MKTRHDVSNGVTLGSEFQKARPDVSNGVSFVSDFEKENPRKNSDWDVLLKSLCCIAEVLDRKDSSGRMTILL
jgi:hypothetical protein